MQVYKAFFKVIYKNLTQIMIYVFVFIFFAVFLSKNYTEPLNTNFSESKINIAFINYDKNSKIIYGLKKYLNKNANFINIEDDTKKLQDALFYRQVDYIVKIPKGFTDKLIKGENPQIERTMVPGSASSVLIDNVFNKYFNTARLYIKTIPNTSEEQLVNYINNDISQKADVNIKGIAKDKTVRNSPNAIYYYNYLSYSLFAILILGVCSVMMVFNNTDLKKRNLCSPLKLRSMNFQLILGNLSFAFIAWLLLVIGSLVMYSEYLLSIRGLMLILNSFAFTLAALSISFLIGNIINSRSAMSAAANVFSLGTCFISGVFVPQAYLGKAVLRIASFTPTYWYVKSNNDIEALTRFNMDNLMPIFSNMLIVIAFAAAAIAIALAYIKQKRMSN